MVVTGSNWEMELKRRETRSVSSEVEQKVLSRVYREGDFPFLDWARL